MNKINVSKNNKNEKGMRASSEELTDDQILKEITLLKNELKDQIVILGHHYQQDDIISFADITGDSLVLAQQAAKITKPYIIFCGVHFMAETADLLTNENQQVILPDLEAGCSMADMANRADVETCWQEIKKSCSDKITPITYINCTADLKAFVGEHQGSICTSSNAKKIIQWALKKSEKLLFFPDQHLGRNTCYELGIPLDDMVVYDPNLPHGGLNKEDIKRAKVILWYGCCSVHQEFTIEQINHLRKESPNTKIIVHPECCFEVVQAADLNGSTAYIAKVITEAKEGSSWAVGTEVNLVNRLAQINKNKQIASLAPFQCLCSTMYRITPKALREALLSIKNKKPINIIKVAPDIKAHALNALNTMLEIS